MTHEKNPKNVDFWGFWKSWFWPFLTKRDRVFYAICVSRLLYSKSLFWSNLLLKTWFCLVGGRHYLKKSTRPLGRYTPPVNRNLNFAKNRKKSVCHRRKLFDQNDKNMINWHRSLMCMKGFWLSVIFCSRKCHFRSTAREEFLSFFERSIWQIGLTLLQRILIKISVLNFYQNVGDFAIHGFHVFLRFSVSPCTLYDVLIKGLSLFKSGRGLMILSEKCLHFYDILSYLQEGSASNRPLKIMKNTSFFMIWTKKPSGFWLELQKSHDFHTWIP